MPPDIRSEASFRQLQWTTGGNCKVFGLGRTRSFVEFSLMRVLQLVAVLVLGHLDRQKERAGVGGESNFDFRCGHLQAHSQAEMVAGLALGYTQQLHASKWRDLGLSVSASYGETP